MTVAFVRQRLYDLGLLLTPTYVTTVHPNVPRALGGAASLPAQVIRVAEARYDLTTLGTGMMSEGRLYNLEYYVRELDGGAEGEAEDAATDIIDPIRDFWLARPQLQIATANTVVYRAVLESDTGAVLGVPYPDNSNKFYASFRLALRVYELHEIHYIG